MKILIVDDELVSRTKLELILNHFGDCETVDSGKKAITRFHAAHRDKDPFDLIMLDINLPGMDGIDVLSEIRESEKQYEIPGQEQVKILMATSYKDKDRVIACAQSGCNDYIGKPFDMDVISKKLEKLGISKLETENEKKEASEPVPAGTSQIFGDVSLFLNSRKIRLPSLPRIQVKFREMVKTGTIFQKIADLLKKDVAISAELIRISNSVYYRGFMENKSLKQAISRLGFAATEQIVNELSSRDFFTMRKKKYRSLIENVWKHSIASAYAAEFTSDTLHMALPADPFTMGLLHDIGKLVLLQIIAEMERRGKFNGGIQEDNLIETIGEHHCLFGAKLLEKWKYSDSYIYTALHHDSLQQQEADGQMEGPHQQEAVLPKELLVVHFANQLAKSIGYDVIPSPNPNMDLQAVVSVKRLKLNSSQIGKTRAKVIEAMQEALELF